METAKSWLEAALTAWQGLNDARRLEMIAASLLSLNELEMGLSNLRLEPAAAGQRPDDLRIAVTSERPSLADLTMMPSNGERVALVKLVIRDQPLVGKSVCHPGLGVDHAAPARATLEALTPVLDEPLSLKDARVLQILDGPFAMVTLRSSARLLVGSAMIENDLATAMARATLDAANRLINKMTPRGDRAIPLS